MLKYCALLDWYIRVNARGGEEGEDGRCECVCETVLAILPAQKPIFDLTVTLIYDSKLFTAALSS